MSDSAKIAHLGFIQAVISRMGSNSFLLKGWSITLVAAIFALSAKDANQKFILAAYFPVIIFWLMDSYFLHQEKLFRELYKQIATGSISSDIFSMDTTSVKNTTPSLSKVAISPTIILFHGTIFSVIIFVMFCLTVNIT